jgi:acyl-homoserine lactone acylase PvdQ
MGHVRCVRFRTGMESNGARVRLIALAATAILVLAVGTAPSLAAQPRALLPPPTSANPATYGLNDAGGFLNVLPPGEAGVDNAGDLALFEANGTIPAHFDDQMPLYQNLVYADPTLTDAQVPSYFKDATFGVKPGDAAKVEQPEPGLTIVRDKSYDVPHIHGDTRAETMFGAGYAGAEDRLFLMDVLRHTARAQLASFAGGSPANRQMDEEQWAIAPYTEADLQSQVDEAPKLYGAEGTQLVQDAQAYVDGVNAYIKAATLNPLLLLPSEYAASGQTPKPWTVTDVIAEASLIGGIFGKGGGNEVNSALALQALTKRFGKKRGEKAWQDFREKNDPEAPTTILKQRFPYETGNPFAKRGLAIPDRGSVTFPPAGSPSAGGTVPTAKPAGALASLGTNLAKALKGPTHASNWELVAARHSANGHPLAVMGPQVGYYVPQILMEEDLHGPGIDARGASFPGVNQYVELGHGRDYAWSATTSTSDNVDTFAEVLCQDAYHYMYKGQCLPMEKLQQTESWHTSLADSTPAGSETLTAYRTVHGIVYARGKVHGKPVAFVHARSSYFHEADSAIGFSELNEPGFVHDPASFQQAASHINFLFNWSYVDASHISYYMSGWLPQRAKGTSPDLPVLGTGQYDWRGYDPATHTADWLPFARHPHITDPDYLVSWNNKQAPGWAAADDHWAYGPIYRSELIANRIKADIAHGRKMTIAQLVQSMDEPATEDIRAVELVPIMLRALGKPRNPALKNAIAQLRQWHADGGRRRDLNRDGHDEDNAAIELMDAWWPKLLQTEFGPLVGPNAFAAIKAMTTFGDTSFSDGWYGYVSKDLRRLFGGHERGKYSQIYCGNVKGKHFRLRGLKARCRRAVRASLAQALGVTPQQTYGAVCPKDPEPSCSDQNTFTYASAITIPSFPFQNRPTFQQVVTLTRNLPR